MDLFDLEILHKEYDVKYGEDSKVTLEQFQLKRLYTHNTDMFDKLSKLIKEMKETKEITLSLYKEYKDLGKKIKECEEKHQEITREYKKYVPQHCHCGDDINNKYCDGTGCW